MQVALIDTIVLYGALNKDDPYHEQALPIFKKMDSGELPVGVILDFVYAETFNALTSSLKHNDCFEAAEILERSGGFEVERTSRDVWVKGQKVHESNSHLSFVDSILVAHADGNNLDHIYSFDSGFDSMEELRRIKTDANPYSA